MKDYPPYLDYPKERAMTNADRHRAMTDEELAKWGYACVGCPPDHGYPDCDITWAEMDGKCYDCWLDWLRQEAHDET